MTDGYTCESKLARSADSHIIKWAAHATAAAVEHVCVNHCGLHIGVAQQLLYGANGVTALEQMSREAVTKSVAAGRLCNLGSLNRSPDSRLQAALIAMVTT